MHVRLARRTLTSVVRNLYVHKINLDSEQLLIVSSCDESSRPLKCRRCLNHNSARPIARTQSHIPQVATTPPSTQEINSPCAGLDSSKDLHKVEAPRISRQSAHEFGKFCQPYAQAAFTRQEGSLALISVRY